jgi:hypothetical protein
MTAVAAAYGSDHRDLASVTDGFSAGILGAAGLAALGAISAAIWLRGPTSVAAPSPEHEVASV